MKYLLRKIKKHIGTLVQIAVVFGAAALILLYFLGYYDFSFLDRYTVFADLLNDSSDRPFVSVDIAPTDKNETSEERLPPEESGDVSSDGYNDIYVAPNDTAVDNTAKIFTSNELDDYLVRIRTVTRALNDGYASTPGDGSYFYSADRTILAKMVFDFKLPTKYANRARNVVKEVIVTPGENGESTDHLTSDERYVILEESRGSRPAVELYMGYIILDDGNEFFLLDSSGKPLCRYDANRYVPAYTRDSEGRPLFKRADEDKVRYFYLSEDGTGFVFSDYNPETDGRGLNFDYPLLWGKSDSTSVFVINETSADTDAMLEELGEEFMLSLQRGDEEAVKALEEISIPIKYTYGYEVRNQWGTVGMLTEVKFSSAQVFMENRAAVTTDEDRGSMYFINQNGYRTFANVNTYVNEHDRYVTEYIMPPLTTGIESLGHYYYEDGIVRIRKQVIDYYNFEVRELTRVVKDYDCLIRLDGSEIPLPAGYTLKGYSEGMAILEKNGLYGVYDITGQWIAQPIYSSASPYMSGLCVLTLPDGRYGMIDREGNIVLPFTYDYISSVSSGLISTYRKENGWGIYVLMDDPAYTEPVENLEEYE